MSAGAKNNRTKAEGVIRGMGKIKGTAGQQSRAVQRALTGAGLQGKVGGTKRRMGNLFRRATK